MTAAVPPEAAAAPTRAFYPRLESVRGIAALMVVAYHVSQVTWLDDAGKAHWLLEAVRRSPTAIWVVDRFANGFAAVTVFFVLSGFVLAQSLDRGPQTARAGTLRFVLARLFRLYPASVVTVGIFVLVYRATGRFFFLPQSFTIKGIVLNALVIDWLMNPVMWTVQIEVLAIPVVLGAHALARTVGVATLPVIVIVLGVLHAIPAWRALFTNHFGSAVMVPFIVGVLIHHAWPTTRPRWPIWLQALAFVLAVLVVTTCRPVMHGGPWVVFVESAAAAVLVCVLARGDLDVLARPFDWRVTEFFGRISYGVYLLHLLAVMLLREFAATTGAVLAAGAPPLAVHAVLVLTAIAFVTPLAWAMHRFVEVPGIAAGRRLVDRAHLGRPPGGS